MADRATTPDTLSFREFADHIGKKPGYVTQLKDQGRLVLTPDRRRVVVAASKQLIADTMDPAKAGVAAHHAATRAAKPTPATTAPPPAGEPDSAADAATAGEGDATDPAAQEANSPFARRRAEAQARREEALARQAERNELKELGELLERGPTVSAIGKHLASLCTTLRALPTSLAPALGAGDEAECRQLLADEIEHALADVDRKMKSIGRPA